MLQFGREKDAAVRVSVGFKIEKMFECVDKRMYVRYTFSIERTYVHCSENALSAGSRREGGRMNTGVRNLRSAMQFRDQERGYRHRNTTSRETENRGHMHGLILSGVVMFVLAFAIFGLTSHADEVGRREYKYYKSVLVTDANELQTQIEEYADGAHYKDIHDYMQEVERINHLPTEGSDALNIAPGNYIILPYYSVEYRF